MQQRRSELAKRLEATGGEPVARTRPSSLSIHKRSGIFVCLMAILIHKCTFSKEKIKQQKERFEQKEIA